MVYTTNVRTAFHPHNEVGWFLQTR